MLPEQTFANGEFVRVRRASPGEEAFAWFQLLRRDHCHCAEKKGEHERQASSQCHMVFGERPVLTRARS